MLNRLWLSLMLLSVFALVVQAFQGEWQLWETWVKALFEMSQLSVDIALGLIGVLCFWMGLFRIAEHTGLIGWVSKLLSPILQRLMPDVPKNHPAFASITANISANMFGLDNAATPLGIQAMRDLQSLNPHKECISAAQIMFLVINTASITLFPMTIVMYRAQQGAANPADIVFPIVVITSISTFIGVIAAAMIQRIRWWDPVLLITAAGYIGFLVFFGMFFRGDENNIGIISNVMIGGTIGCILIAAWIKKIDAYSAFIQGAKSGFAIALRIIPYLVIMLVAIGGLRASGVLEAFTKVITFALTTLGLPDDFVEALPIAVMKPFSGSGSRALTLELMHSAGVDSFVARVGAMMQGSTETTFYVLAVYLGAVGIKQTRYLVSLCLFADAVALIAAVILSYWFFAP
ncbi:MAG: nucleoside recognition domain-containing protein [Pseudomonadota bacterium]